MATHNPIRTMITPLLASFRSLTLRPSTFPSPSSIHPSQTIMRALSTTPALSAATHSGRPGRKSKRKGAKIDSRITLIRYHLQHPKMPRPLRLSRMRALRHWTIQRAWSLARRKKLEGEENELHRMYQSMQEACEELRNLDPPGTKDAGRLYRIAMLKKGVFGAGNIPIEYARMQTDTPGTEAWNHGWTR